MASSYTANIGIEKPGSGEQAGTWGTTTNTNFDIIDRAINGVGAITLSGTTHTLTTSDGSLSDGHFKVLVLGGSPSGTNTITIDPNDQDKLYLVKNGSGQTVTFTQGSGGNVSILNGDLAWIFADGAGSGAAVTQLTINTSQITDSAVTTAKIADGTIATADIADGAITAAKILDGTIGADELANDAATAAKVAIDVQTKSGTASVTMTSTAVQTFIKHSGTGTLSIGAGQYDGQTVNVASTGTMTLSWHGSSLGVSLGNQAKLASGIYDTSAGYWFFSETVTS